MEDKKIEKHLSNIRNEAQMIISTINVNQQNQSITNRRFIFGFVVLSLIIILK